jgi:hypothetical protein
MENIKSYFPDSLRSAIVNQIPGGLCCSTVVPGDTHQQNALGTVGLIFDLMTEDSLVAVSPGDGGAHFTKEGTRDFDPKYKSINLAAVEASITNRPRGSYNEWGIQNYLVRGFFVFPPPLIVRTAYDCQTEIRLCDLYGQFPGQRVYAFQETEIVELHPRSRIVRVDHTEIYR